MRSHRINYVARFYLLMLLNGECGAHHQPHVCCFCRQSLEPAHTLPISLIYWRHRPYTHSHTNTCTVRINWMYANNKRENFEWTFFFRSIFILWYERWPFILCAAMMIGDTRTGVRGVRCIARSTHISALYAVEWRQYTRITFNPLKTTMNKHSTHRRHHKIGLVHSSPPHQPELIWCFCIRTECGVCQTGCTSYVLQLLVVD